MATGVRSFELNALAMSVFSIQYATTTVSRRRTRRRTRRTQVYATSFGQSPTASGSFSSNTVDRDVRRMYIVRKNLAATMSPTRFCVASKSYDSLR